MSRSTAYHQPKVERLRRPVDEALARTIHEIIQAHPTYGIRRVWAWLKHRLNQPANRKKIHRLMRIKGWTMRQRAIGKRPRVPGIQIHRTRAQSALVHGYRSHRVRQGWVVRVRSRARLLHPRGVGLVPRPHRPGSNRRARPGGSPDPPVRLDPRRPKGLTLRHDNGLVFGSRLYRALARDYGLKQEYITPYTPQQNGLCERFNRSFKEECAWLHRFQDIQEARVEVARYIDHYNHERPHQSLDYQTPHQAFLNPNPAA